MNILELANKLYLVEASYGFEYVDKAATMLRQQAKRIEELEIELEKKIERERYKSELITLLIKNIVDACNETLRMAAEK